MLYKQLLLYWVICKLLWSHEKPHVWSYELGGETKKKLPELPRIMRSMMPVSSSLWSSWLPRDR